MRQGSASDLMCAMALPADVDGGRGVPAEYLVVLGRKRIS
jgi:hypothetical protein